MESAVAESVVAYDVGDCRDACEDNYSFRGERFECRSFAFSQVKDEENGNCHLSPEDPRDSGFKRRFLVRHRGYRVFERRSFGCENDQQNNDDYETSKFAHLSQI